ncbi:MAG: DsbA family protein [Myxococcota bacterium]
MILLTSAVLAVGCGGGGHGEAAPAAEAGGAEGGKAAATSTGAAAAAAAAAPVGSTKSVGDYSAPTTPTEKAKVQIIEFSDFQCPFCSRVNPTMAKIKETYKGDVAIAFMHNALPFHKEARLAAIASVAADNQGKFWEMHDKLFSNQRALKEADLKKYASELCEEGDPKCVFNMEKFEAELKNSAIGAWVDKNRAISNAVGASGTPAFFVNGKVLKGAQPFQRFKEIIDAEIVAANTAGKMGEEWLKERLKTNNKDLSAYIHGGKTPPAVTSKSQKKNKQRPPDRTVYKVSVDPKTDAMKGDVNAPVTIVVFSEFQCPFCKRVLPSLEAVEKEFGEKVRIVFKHNPLPFHKDAFPASEAAMCANDQGKFWEYHDKLFANQRALKGENLTAYATELGLNMAKFKRCMEAGTHKGVISADQELAGKVTARGTPNTFINGRKLTGAKPPEEFKSLVAEELKKAEKLAVAKSIAPEKLYDEIIKNGKVFEPLDAKVHTFDLSKANVIGNPKAKVQIVEFSDFQCPFCSRVGKPLKEVQAHYGKDLVVAFKHFPLNFHREAKDAAIAAECAGAQGKFWEYHDELFTNQKELAQKKFDTYADTVGLDDGKFEACLEDPKIAEKVEADMSEARKAQVRGTPTIFINGRKFTSPSGYNKAAFVSVIDKYLLKPKK